MGLIIYQPEISDYGQKSIFHQTELGSFLLLASTRPMSIGKILQITPSKANAGR